MKVVLTGNFQSDLLNSLTSYAIVHEQRDFSRSSIFRLLSDAYVYVLGGPEYLDAELLNKAQRLRLIVVLGTGISSFLDEEAAVRLGIEVQNTPHLNCDAVANFARQIIECEASGIFESIKELKDRRSWSQGIRKQLASLKIGIIGGGPTAASLMNELQKCGLQTFLYSSRTEKPEFLQKYGAVYCNHEDVFKHSDIVSVHYRYSESHKGIFDHLLKFGRGQVKVLNFSNPYLFSSEAVKNALRYGLIKSFFIDGYYGRNVPNFLYWDDPEKLIDLPGFTATSHIAALEESCILSILSEAFKKVSLFLEGNYC